MKQGQQGPDAELPFEAEPDVDRDPDHREQDRQSAVAGQLLRHLARDRFGGADLDPGVSGGQEGADLGHHLIGGAIGAIGPRQADLIAFAVPELLDVGVADLELGDPSTQLLDVDPLGEGHPDLLPADEIDAQVEAAIGDQRQACGGGNDRQDQRQIAPAHEVQVGIVGDQFEQLHCLNPVKY